MTKSKTTLASLVCGLRLNPFRHIINNNKDVKITKDEGNGPIKSIPQT
jgi:hypothetical protein